MEKDKNHPRTDETDNITIDKPEPWEPWETKLVCFSIILGIGMIVVGGVLVNMFIL